MHSNDTVSAPQQVEHQEEVAGQDDGMISVNSQPEQSEVSVSAPQPSFNNGEVAGQPYTESLVSNETTTKIALPVGAPLGNKQTGK